MPNALETARLAATAGGAILRARRDDPGIVRSKSSSTDFVSEADIASGIAVVKTIIGSDAQARVVVEEPEVCEQLGIVPGTLDDDEVWIVDPLDGTTSYLHHFPAYSVSVALVRDGRPVVGAVYNAASGEMFSAVEGGGGTLDGGSVQCTNVHTIREALVITGFPYDRGETLDRQLEVLGAFLRAPVHGIRRDGTAALDCCHVAAGRADGFWEFALKPWDTAAGVIIAREAGAVATDCSGAEWTTASDSICLANGRLHAEMLRVIDAAAAGV